MTTNDSSTTQSEVKRCTAQEFDWNAWVERVVVFHTNKSVVAYEEGNALRYEWFVGEPQPIFIALWESSPDYEHAPLWYFQFSRDMTAVELLHKGDWEQAGSSS